MMREPTLRSEKIFSTRRSKNPAVDRRAVVGSKIVKKFFDRRREFEGYAELSS